MSSNLYYLVFKWLSKFISFRRLNESSTKVTWLWNSSNIRSTFKYFLSHRGLDKLFFQNGLEVNHVIVILVWKTCRIMWNWVKPIDHWISPKATAFYEKQHEPMLHKLASSIIGGEGIWTFMELSSNKQKLLILIFLFKWNCIITKRNIAQAQIQEVFMDQYVCHISWYWH